MRRSLSRFMPLAIVLVALAFRLILLANVSFPGIADPNHYYNMGVRWLAGDGFTIDYVWQYSQPPADIVHPEDHWMPGAAWLAGIGMAAFGVGVRGALVSFVVLGALLPLITMAAARRLGVGRAGRAFAGMVCALLPEFVLNSLRTDTTVPAAVLVGGALLLLAEAFTPPPGEGWGVGVRLWRVLILAALAGGCVGLAYLTRSDAALLLPTVIVWAGVMMLPPRPSGEGRGVRAARAALLVAVFSAAFALTIAPWIARNLREIGRATSPETSRMFFFTHHDDHYAYGRDFTLQTLLAAQTPAEILGKRLFEAAAGVQMMIASADALAFPLIGGALLLIVQWRTERRRWRSLLPALILLGGGFVAYAVFIPYKAQAGSLKKITLTVLPLLIPIAAYTLERTIRDRRLRNGAGAILLALLAINAVQRVRTDAAQAAGYLAQVEQAIAAARALPDTNGDGEIRLMTQDPYIVRYAGLRSVIYPYEPLDVILEVTTRYRIDYLLTPANRYALDPIVNGAAGDARLVEAARVPGTPFALWSIETGD